MSESDDESSEKKGPGKPPLVEYPTVYAFKVMGKQEHGFKEYVRQLFHRTLGAEVSPDSISEQPSRQGRYLSVTVSVYLISEAQRIAVYAALHKEKRILYYL